MNVVVSKRAERTVARIDAYWVKHAELPDTFLDELGVVFDQLATFPELGTAVPTRTHPGPRRVLLPKSGCHIYFEVVQRRQEVVVIQLWDARRGRGPKL
jgi:plasmid stabilization system protein ParE